LYRKGDMMAKKRLTKEQIEKRMAMENWPKRTPDTNDAIAERLKKETSEYREWLDSRDRDKEKLDKE